MIKRTQILVLSMAFGLVATVAWADFKLERALALEPGGSFVLETDIGDVVLTGEASSGARVLVTSDENLDQTRFRVRRRPARGQGHDQAPRDAPPVQRLVPGRRYPHRDSGAHENRGPPQHVRRINRYITRVTGAVNVHTGRRQPPRRGRRRECRGGNQRRRHPHARRARRCRGQHIGRQHHDRRHPGEPARQHQRRRHPHRRSLRGPARLDQRGQRGRKWRGRARRSEQLGRRRHGPIRAG